MSLTKRLQTAHDLRCTDLVKLVEAAPAHSTTRTRPASLRLQCRKPLRCPDLSLRRAPRSCTFGVIASCDRTPHAPSAPHVIVDALDQIFHQPRGCQAMAGARHSQGALCWVQHDRDGQVSAPRRCSLILLEFLAAGTVHVDTPSCPRLDVWATVHAAGGCLQVSSATTIPSVLTFGTWCTPTARSEYHSVPSYQRLPNQHVRAASLCVQATEFELDSEGRPVLLVP